VANFRLKPALTDYARIGLRILCNASSARRAHGCLTQVMARAPAVTRRANEDVSQSVESREITTKLNSPLRGPGVSAKPDQLRFKIGCENRG